MKYALTILGLLLITGCATSYQVEVSGFAEPDTAIPPNAQIYVRSDPKVSNPVFYNQIKIKIQKLLSANGYQPGFDENARYQLSFFFSEYDRTMLRSRYDPAASYYGYDYRYRGLGYGGHFTPYSETYQHYIMMIRVQDRTTESVVWVGEAAAVKTYPYKREAVNYLLLALFKYFGQDTDKEIKVTIKENDVQQSVLKEPEF